MGNKASKAASSAAKTATAKTKPPRTTTTTTRSARNVDADMAKQAAAAPAQRAASETKDAGILDDAMDPTDRERARNTGGAIASGLKGQLSQNLASLGQAQIQDAQRRNPTRFTPDSSSARVLQRRAELEEQESSISSSSATRNRLTASNLAALLDARKEIRTTAEYKRLCDDFNCDPEAVTALTRFVNSPSLILQRTKQQEKEDEYLARWVDPAPFQNRISG